jgi:outer membrane protein OmpA-like peptidoglycan-associated protein
MIDSGVPESRVQAKGFGEDKPISPGNTNADHAKNRRVEFRFAPTAAQEN